MVFFAGGGLGSYERNNEHNRYIDENNKYNNKNDKYINEYN